MTTLKYICIPNLEGTFDSQSKCKDAAIKDALVLPYQPVELNKELVFPLKFPLVAPPLVESSDIRDIANYAYIWFNNESKTITEKEKDFIHETITKGTFPTYLQQKYSNAERQALFTNEIKFVRQKFTDANLSHITILQIPRILYDLFNLFYLYNKSFSSKPATITYICVPDIDTIEKYNDYTNKNIDKLKDNIFKLNDKIITFLNTNGFLGSNTIVREYTDILDLIIKDISEISVEHRKHVSPQIDTDEKKKILYEILDFEKQQTSNSILLYRGANFTLDSTIEIRGDRKQYPCSLSSNLSILNGFLTDQTACTIIYMTHVDIKNDKIKYTINKFMFGDGSEEDSLFFIPPIPPYLQLYCNGELWHPRTKIGSDSSNMIGRGRPKGLLCFDINFHVVYTYLESDKTMAQLEELYQSYKTNGDINTWLRKYIKYKTKYLELKNQLGK